MAKRAGSFRITTEPGVDLSDHATKVKVKLTADSVVTATVTFIGVRVNDDPETGVPTVHIGGQ